MCTTVIINIHFFTLLYFIILLSDQVPGENINEAIVAEGLASVRGGGPEMAKIQELESQAKAAGKGIWSSKEKDPNPVNSLMSVF